MSSLFIGNISNSIGQSDLESEFQKYGPCKINYKGAFAFAEFENDKDAEVAMEKLQKKNMGGRELNIEWSKKKKEESFLEFIEFVYSQVTEYSENNISKRLENFFQYIDDINELRAKYIENIMLVKNENTEDKGKDIIFFWKIKIAEEYFEEHFDKHFFETNASKKLLSLLLEHNYNVNMVAQFFRGFEKILDKNFNQETLFTSLLSTLTSYPDSISKEIRPLIEEYCLKCENNEKDIDKKKKNSSL